MCTIKGAKSASEYFTEDDRARSEGIVPSSLLISGLCPFLKDFPNAADSPLGSLGRLRSPMPMRLTSFSLPRSETDSWAVDPVGLSCIPGALRDGFFRRMLVCTAVLLNVSRNLTDWLHRRKGRDSRVRIIHKAG